MIDKILPRLLNSSSDNRLKKATEMNDALNVVATDNFDQGLGGNDNGDAGVLKPVPSNSLANWKPSRDNQTIENIFPDSPGYTRRTIGSVSDPKAGVVYFFVYSNFTEEQGVYAYDAYDFFGGGAFSWRRIFATSEFQFQDTGRVQATVVYNMGVADDPEGQEFRPILYFTDDVNEPRKLDVLRCVEQGDTPQAFGAEGVPLVQQKDMITACPKTPLFAPEYQFFYNAQRPISDLRNVRGLQFAFQCKYYTGEVSALSTYSDIVVPPQYPTQGLYSGQLQIPQGVRLFIQSEVAGGYNFSEEIEEVRILVREGNDGAFFIIDTIPYAGEDVLEYEFYNDRVLTGITTEEERKNFDNLPQVAQAIASCENRLFFGNYIEGYDEVPLVGTVTARYGSNESSVLDLTIPITTALLPGPPDPDFSNPWNYNTFAQTEDQYTARKAGLRIDCSAVPETIEAGVEISVNIAMSPDGDGFSVYNQEKSYHAGRSVGYIDSAGQAQLTDNTMFSDPIGVLINAGGTLTANGKTTIPLSGANFGVGGDVVWRTDTVSVTDNQLTDEIPVRYGTSAGSPMRIPGPQDTGDNIEFSVILETLTVINDAPNVLANALATVLSGQPEQLPEGQFNVVQSNVLPAYSWNLGYQDPDDESGDTNLTVSSVPSFKIDPSTDRSRIGLVTAVFNDSEGNISGPSRVSDTDSTPCGYFIINQGNVRFRLVHLDGWEPNTGTAYLTMEVDQLVASDVRTCIPILRYDDFRLIQYRVFSGEFIRTHLLNDIIIPEDAQNTYWNGNTAQYLSALYVSGSPVSDVSHPFISTETFQNRARTIGWLASNDGTVNADLSPTDFYISNQQRREQLNQGATPDGLWQSILNRVGTSFVDMENDFSIDELPKNFNTINFLELTGSFGQLEMDFLTNDYATNPNSSYVNVGPYGTQQMLTGRLHRITTGTESTHDVTIDLPFNFIEDSLGDLSGVSAMYNQSDLTGLFNEAYWTFNENKIPFKFSAIRPSTSISHTLKGQDTPTLQPGFDLDTIKRAAEVEILQQSVVAQALEQTGVYRSFKSKAMHDFGVVYYDERGRPGTVNRLPSVYVQGYAERNAKGRAYIDIQLNSAPPPWAWYYQIVYAGNNSVLDFVQYTMGGAFYNVRQDNTGTSPIYVSLNYLQGNQSVSYNKAWGASHPDGTPDLYVYTPGDYLRVISYYDTSGDIVYPYELVFEIIDQVTLTGSPEDHPLWEGGGPVPDYLRGQFLVLRDNAGAAGFNFTSVLAADNQPESAFHNWNNRCLVEIVKPKRVQDEEQRPYYEIGRTYNVGLNSDGVYHTVPTIRINEGDVWWRRVPMNFPQYDDVQGVYVNLIQDSTNEEPDTPEAQQYPLFAGVYVENNSFTDTFPGADQFGYGKMHYVVQNPGRVRRYSSVTYSDENDNQTRTLRYTSFNPYNAPFKDLPTEHGAINALVEIEDLFVVQEDKTSILPINRTILADAAGVDTLIGSEKIIGLQKLIPGSFGADNNRESVLKVDGAVYFANKSKHQVYRFIPGKGVEIISDKGMDSFFVQAFRGVGFNENVRIISGYDPLKDEYIISIIEAEPITNEVGQSIYTRSTLPVIPDTYGFNPPDPIDGDTGGGPIDVPGGGPIEDTDGATFEAELIDPAKEGIPDLSDEGGTAPDGVVPSDAAILSGDPDAVIPGFPSDGFVVTDSVGPPDPVLEIISWNAQEIDKVVTGTSDGFLPYNVRESYDGLIQEVGPTKTVDLSPILPNHVARTLGSQPLYGLNNEIAGNFFAESNSFVVNSNSFAYADPVDFLIGSNDIPDAFGYENQITENNTIQGGATVFGTTPVVSPVRLSTLLSIRKLQLDDYYIERIVEVLKKGYETQVLSLYDNAVTIFEAAKESAAISGIDQDPNLAALISNANAQQQIVDDLLQFQFQRDVEVPYEYFSSARDNGQVGGFGVHTIEKFPLNAADQNNLESLQTAINNFGTLVAGFLNLDGLDLSAFIESVIASNAALRTQVNVLTDQIQELSIAPQELTLIEGVNTDQLAEDTLSVLSQRDGDNILSYADVKREFPDLDALFTAAAETGVTIDSPLVRDIIVRYAQLTADGSFAQGGKTGSPGSDDGNLLAFTRAAQIPIDAKSDLNDDGLISTGDLLSFLVNFGDPVDPYGAASEATVDQFINIIVEEFNA